MCVAIGAAVLGAGALSAGATAYAGSEAASATESSTKAGIAEEQQALGQQEQLAAPYTNIGAAAIPQYQALLGIGPGGAAGEQAALAATPGYQFTLGQGTQNTVNQASAMGLGLSGNTLEGLTNYASGLADTTYQQALGNAQGAVGLGQAAAAGQAANIGNAANTISSSLINQGSTIAGIDTNTIAGLTKNLGGAVNSGILANTLSNLNNANTQQGMAALQPIYPEIPNEY